MNRTGTPRGPRPAPRPPRAPRPYPVDVVDRRVPPSPEQTEALRRFWDGLLRPILARPE